MSNMYSNETVDTESFVEMSSFQDQKELVNNCMNETLVLGETWYLVDVHWYKQWQKYIDFAINGREGQEHHPGPINNSQLLISNSKKLKEHLLEGADYKLISSEGWQKLIQWYKLFDTQNPISRQVIESGKYTKENKVEIYLVELKLTTFKDLENVIVKEFSRTTKLESVMKTMKELFNIPEDEQVRLWNTYLPNTYEQIGKIDSTLQDFGVGSGQTLVLEQRNEKKEWTRQTRSRSLSGSSPVFPQSSSDSPYLNKRTAAGGYSSYSSRQKSPTTSKGLCGLGNLGNTCFMNSALQCLSNTTPLRNFFLSSTYKHELNPTNPLGMQGKIAEAFAELLEQMWNEQNHHVAPRHFKMNVGRFAPQFSGYQQQDSQELLAFLLDGLHEDLNRVKQKPYIEMEDDKGRPDEVLAKEAWSNHSLRNSSVITDNFHGLFKSTVECPECNKRSITFDPFCYLSLPLPIKKERALQVTFVSLDPSKKPVKMKVVVAKAGCTPDLTAAVSKMTGADPNKLVVADVFNSKFHKLYSRSDSLNPITDRDDIYVYEVPVNVNKTENDDLLVLPVYLREIRPKTSSYSYSPNILFGKPTMISVSKDATTTSDLYQIILRSMRRYVISTTVENDVEETMSTTEENENQDISMSDDEVVETGNEEVETGNEEVETGNEEVETGNDSNIVSANIKEDEKEHENENEVKDEKLEEARVPTRLFDIKIINHNGSNDIKALSYDDTEPVHLDSHSYLAIDWYPKLKKMYYKEDIAEIHSKFLSLENSMNRMRFQPRIHEYDKHPSLHEIPTKKTINLDDCLNLFLQREKLGDKDPWYCPECKEHRQAFKKFDLWSLPKVLVIHLKRFSYNRYWRDKLDTLVNFPVKGLELTNYVIDKSHPSAVYDLHAVSNHYGGLGGGHYTAYAVNWFDGQWYYFDDSSVSKSDSVSPISKNAYLLFYTRREDPDVDIWSSNDLVTEDNVDE